MPEPPATPAVRAREAEARALMLLLDAAARELGDYEVHARAYRDAVAARVTEELLAGGTPVWAATTLSGWAYVSRRQPDENGCLDEHDDQWFNVPDNVQLTPPGTVRQAVLLIPEATE